MWPYFGAKTYLVDLYPAPVHDRIIEPFAGTARYALKYWERSVLLIDKYPAVVEMWKFLQQASPADILRLPRKMLPGQHVDNLQFDCPQAKLLFRFIIGIGQAEPRNRASPHALFMRPNSINHRVEQIAANIYKVKHWEFLCGSYSDHGNERATWFIDPPYQQAGTRYKFSSKHIDYTDLSAYCLSRDGQVIVCEAAGAKWLDFQPLREVRGIFDRKYAEVVFHSVDNIPRPYTYRQLKLF